MNKWARGAHPFFWLVAAAAVPALVTGLRVYARSPGYALNSVVVYRLEVGLGCLLGLYGLVLLLWLAYQGRAIKVKVGPGEIQGPDPAAGLDEAATGFEEFKEDTAARLDAHDEALESLDARLTTVEGKG